MIDRDPDAPDQGWEPHPACAGQTDAGQPDV